ncbi:S8 family serine peptidase [Dactylosporangium sp. AC04546]|uniref:S8 family serine peptidase n=1 Tax=Dactylosporangium sp. AC04546 TaxID=2862460 RepID=UPI001EDF3C5C|nr:S8 family serine peptidase [Dactylosporangium sp. AC04546]WVK84809.1 S8 family serine peptidase [Dactylosporangium sp. AC04546]
MRFPMRRAAAFVAGVLALGGVAATPSAAHADPGAAPQGTRPGIGKPVRITLITGDVVELSPAGDGRVAAAVRPGAGRERVTFHTLEVDGRLRVLPSDVVPYLSAGRLDANLFDVEELVADGYADDEASSLPLIVRYAGGAPAAAGARMLAGNGRPLPSVGGAAIRADKTALAGFWSAQSNVNVRSMTGGIDKIWLDGKAHASLDKSTVQIGAPTAWQLGLDGTGVKVAVLDTGVDATHPDLKGRVKQAVNFTETGDAVDHHGHGTHVAATVAGNGTRKGVAPGADLLVGKVLDDNGSGYDSWIIAGMEWAAAQGARVVSMSLGGDPSDGTDPMSEAVNRLSTETGTLFVVAAGNAGPAARTVGTPGAADAALTVGAVDRADAIADFSSRGPRIGDEVLKPEITAPGVGIVAARAAGTSMGQPVDELYTAASGTSMATPHVAGAAVVLAQQHPDWTGARLKEALVSTARTTAGAAVYEQGAGRVDVARAVTQAVTGTATITFGGDRASDVTYRNAGAAPVVLTLATQMPGVTLASNTVTVPANGTASVHLNLANSKPGVYGGWVTATGAGGITVTTALAATIDGPHHRVTVRAPVSVPVFTLFGDDARFDVIDWLGTGERVYDVQEGAYLMHAVIEDSDRATLIVDPELVVDRDVTVFLDPGKARPITIETPKPSEQRTVLSYYAHRITGTGRQIDHGVMHFSNVEQVSVTPTRKLAKGKFEFASRWQLVAPLVRATADGVPVDLNLTAFSPTFPGTRRYQLVRYGERDLRGKAVLIPASPDRSEEEQVAEVAGQGAAVALLWRPADQSAWTNWTPQGDRSPTVALAVPNELGTRLLKARTLELTLTPASPYLYDVFQVSEGRIPDRIVHRVTEANSMRIDTRYVDSGGLRWAGEQRFGWRPWQEYSWNDTTRTTATGVERTEWVSAGDTLWQHRVAHDLPWSDWGPLQYGMVEPPRSYRPGRSSDTWFGPVVRPAGTATRTGDTLALRIPAFADAAGHVTIAEADTLTATLSRDGRPLATLPDGWQDVAVPSGPAAYRLVMSVGRGSDEWTIGTRTETVWDFHSGRTDRTTALPLLQVDYGVPADLTGTVPGRPHLIAIRVPGASGVTVEVSFDEGADWQRAFVAGAAGSYVAIVPGGKGSVSLRVHASDRAGNAVTQTVIRAYGLS